MIFDLWDTLADWPLEGWRRLQERMAGLLGLDEERFKRIWYETYHLRQTGPIRDALQEVGADGEPLEQLLELRSEFTRAALVPRPGAVETLRELRGRGHRLGLISVCTEEVPLLWEATPFAGLLDDAVFSCLVGLAKPDPLIYRLAAERLGVEPEQCLFVGDGANDELAGAERAGMKAVLILRPEQEEPYWEEARGWQPRITSIPEVMKLC